MNINNTILDNIGCTPLVRLNKVIGDIDAEILVKVEYLNPSGSIKDRIALCMISTAEREGKLKPGYTIVEATTGNTGASLCFVGAAKGYKLRMFTPKFTASPERIKIMRMYGAEIEVVDTEAFMREAGENNSGAHGGKIEVIPRQKCLELETSDPTVWWARQFNNPDNCNAHRDGTGREIIEQTDGNVDAFVASVGTGGTLMGVTQALKQINSNVEIYAVEPEEVPHLKTGMENVPIIPGINDGILLDISKEDITNGVISISNQEAIAMAHNMAEQEGLFCGISSGANVLAAIQVAKQLGKGARVVTVLPDNRYRYTSLEKYTT
ncbi:PLP-dependent cysteine synthase family protein [Chloroflexota bacterium]